jgi:DNA-binding transcriptional LysR family regulator
VELEDMRVFVAVAEARPVSRAARDRRPFALTATGQAVLERCRRVLHAVRDVRSLTHGDGLPPPTPAITRS